MKTKPTRQTGKKALEFLASEGALFPFIGVRV
jgi:hypothetical protein